MLDVTSAELRSWKAKRLTAKQGHGLGLDFADIAGSSLEVGKAIFVAMPEDNMRLCSAEHKPTTCHSMSSARLVGARSAEVAL